MWSRPRGIEPPMELRRSKSLVAQRDSEVGATGNRTSGLCCVNANPVAPVIHALAEVQA
jgi:hypothetical protein